MEGFCEEIGKLNHLLEILIEIFKKTSFNGNHILKLKETKSSFTVWMESTFLNKLREEKWRKFSFSIADKTKDHTEYFT